jgi:hypothetical protein
MTCARRHVCGRYSRIAPIIWLLCFETNNIFQQASKPSYSVTAKYKTRLERVRRRHLPRIKSNHAMPQCIHRAILEICIPIPRVTASPNSHKKKSKVHYFRQRNHETYVQTYPYIHTNNTIPLSVMYVFPKLHTGRNSLVDHWTQLFTNIT